MLIVEKMTQNLKMKSLKNSKKTKLLQNKLKNYLSREKNHSYIKQLYEFFKIAELFASLTKSYKNPIFYPSKIGLVSLRLNSFLTYRRTVFE